MKIEQVRLNKTLKAGKNVWVEGSFFPNEVHPSIPHEILLEVRLNTGSVEVTKYGKLEPIITSKKGSITSISSNVVTFDKGRDSLEESLIREKQQVETVVIPKQRKSKLVKKSKLVRR